MPKVNNTRKHKAIELLKRVRTGPSLSIEAFGIDGVSLTPNERSIINSYFMYHYKLWSETWIVTQLQELVPELKA